MACTLWRFFYEAMKNIPIEYYERAAEILRYEPESGKLIRFFKNGNFKYTGSVDSKGYRRVGITVEGKSKLLRVHRIIYFLHYGYLPEMLDHIDGDRSNDRIENLRPATLGENSRNRKSAKNSSSQYLGVSWHKDSQKWTTNIYIDGKLKYLGRFTSEKKAALAYDAAARLHHGDFANPNFK